MEVADVIVAHADALHGGARVVVAHGGDQAVDFIVDGGEDT